MSSVILALATIGSVVLVVALLMYVHKRDEKAGKKSHL